MSALRRDRPTATAAGAGPFIDDVDVDAGATGAGAAPPGTEDATDGPNPVGELFVDFCGLFEEAA